MPQPDMKHHFTHLTHTRAYPAISSNSSSHSAYGKFILITNGSQGIGLATATAFAASGAAHIILLARNLSTLREAKNGLVHTNPGAKSPLSSLTLPTQVQSRLSLPLPEPKSPSQIFWSSMPPMPIRWDLRSETPRKTFPAISRSMSSPT